MAILEQFDKAEDESLESAKAIAEADPERLKGLTLEDLATEFMAVCMQVRYMQIRIAMLEKRPKRVEQLLDVKDDSLGADNAKIS